MQTFIYHDGQEYFYTDIPYMITVDLLEKDYMAYKFLLEKYAEYKTTEEYQELYDEETEDHLTDKLNDTTEYGVWYSSHLHSLAYLAGDPTDFAKSKRSELEKGGSGIWYGCSTNIPESDAINIAHLMISLGANLDISNYYGDTLIDTLEKKDSLTGRENDNFSYYIKMRYIDAPIHNQ